MTEPEFEKYYRRIGWYLRERKTNLRWADENERLGDLEGAERLRAEVDVYESIIGSTVKYLLQEERK